MDIKLLEMRFELSKERLKAFKDDLERKQSNFAYTANNDFLKYDIETNMINDLIEIIKLKKEISALQMEVTVIEETLKS